MFPNGDPPLEAGALVAGYVVERLLGYGGMGAVYSATHPIIGRRAALKVLHRSVAMLEGGIARLIQEARLVNQIRHPNIVDVSGFEQLPDGRAVLVMELLEGETLASLLTRVGRTPAARAIALVLPVLGALSAAHAAGIIHRDLKPENLFVSRDALGAPTVKVLDFGIAKLLDPAHAVSLTSAGSYIGTPKYMSPEQCRAEALDGRSDLYAMGLILYELLTGRSAFVAHTPAEFFADHLRTEPTSIGVYVQTDPRLADIVHRLLKKDREARPRSAGALERELRACLAPEADANSGVASERTELGAVPRTLSSDPRAIAPPQSTGNEFTRGVVAGLVATPSEENRVCTILCAEMEALDANGAHVDPSARFGPDVASEMFDECFARVAETIEKFGGVIDTSGDQALTAVFGIPRSTENDAERAVHAALRLKHVVERFAARNRRLASGGITLSLQAALGTGVVFLGRAGRTARRDSGVTGEPLNFARRLLKSAKAGELILAHATFVQVAGVFEVEEASPIASHGSTLERSKVYRVRGVATTSTDAARDVFYGRKTAFVGRRADLDAITEAIEQTIEDRRAQVMTLVGAAGSGKTRLRNELAAELSRHAGKPLVLLGRGSQLNREEPFDLVSGMLRRRFRIAAEDPREVIEQKLRNGLRMLGREPPLGVDPASATSDSSIERTAAPDSQLDTESLDESLGFLATMLGARASALTAAGESVDDLGTRMTLAFSRLLSRMSAQRPVVLLCDAIEACDDASLNLLDSVVVRLVDAPIFVLATARPELFERRPHWGEGGESHVRRELAPLGRRTLEEISRDLLGRVPAIPPEFLRRLVDRAEGNPFVLEETLRVLVESVGAFGDDPLAERWIVREDRLDQLTLPTAVHALVQARLDRLPPDLRATLQRAAVVGRIFWEGALATIARESATSLPLREALERLRVCDLVRTRERATFPAEREFVFADTVTQEVAYESLSARTAARHHRSVAEWLEQRGEAFVDANAALLARHYDRADSPREAIAYHEKAGDRAATLGQNADAIRYYQRACAMADAVRGFPEGSQKDVHAVAELRVADWPRRVRLRLSLGDTLRRVGRLDEAIAIYEVARANIVRIERRTTAEVGDVERRAHFEGSIELRIGLAEDVRSSHLAALDRYRVALRLLAPEHGAEGDPRLLAALHARVGFAELRTGAPERALASGLRGLRVCARIARDQPDRAEASSRILGCMGNVFYERGQLVRAERLYRQAARVVDDKRYPQLAAIAINNLAAVHFRRGNLGAARDLFRRALTLKERIGDLFDLAVAYNNVAEVELSLNEVDAAHEHVKRAVQIAEGLRSASLLPDVYRNLAEVLRARSELVPALKAARRAFEAALAPAGTSYLPSTATALAAACQAALEARDALGAATWVEIEALVEAVHEIAPRRLREAGLVSEAQSFEAALAGYA